MLYRYVRSHYRNHYLENIRKSIRRRKTVLLGGVPDECPAHEKLLKQLVLLAGPEQQKKLEETGLPLEKGKPAVIFWPTFFDSPETFVHEIDICPACFGALILHGTSMGKLSEEEMSAVMCTVLVLRNPDGSWPSRYSYDQSLVYSGTFNQTTIALATLMRYRFLNPELPAAHLEKRLQFFRKSLHWLLETRHRDLWGPPGI